MTLYLTFQKRSHILNKEKNYTKKLKYLRENIFQNASFKMKKLKKTFYSSPEATRNEKPFHKYGCLPLKYCDRVDGRVRCGNNVPLKFRLLQIKRMNSSENLRVQTQTQVKV